MTNLDEQLAALFATRERVRQRNGRTEFLADDGQWVGTEEESTVRREQVVRQRRTRGRDDVEITLAVLIGKVLWSRGVLPAEFSELEVDVNVFFQEQQTFYLKRGTEPLVELGTYSEPFLYYVVEENVTDFYPPLSIFLPVGRDRFIVQDISEGNGFITDGSTGSVTETYRNYGRIYTFQGATLQLFSSDNAVPVELPPNITNFIYTDLNQYSQYLFPNRATPPPLYQQALSSISSTTHPGYLGTRLAAIEVEKPAINVLGNLSWTSLMKNSNRTVKANGNTVGIGRLNLTEVDLSLLGLTLDTPLYDNFPHIFDPPERFTTNTLRTLRDSPYEDLFLEPINESFLLQSVSGYTQKTAYYVHQWLAFID